jgi:Fur family ferric uptake transcriptional regulator
MAELQDSIIEHSISRATVYNTLALLEKANIILRLEKDFGVRAQQYELVNNKDSFVHIICQKCGRVKKVSDATIARMLADKRWSNFVPQHFSLYVYGKCRVCKNKLNDKQG